MANLPAYQYIDPDLLVDPHHPHNQKFFNTQQRLQRLLVAIQAKMTPKHVEIVKLHHRSLSAKEIADRVGRKHLTIYSVLKRPDAQELLEYLRYYDGHMDGPSVQHRKSWINDIIVDNIEDDPRVALSAIAELNKMDGVYQKDEAPQINITINQTDLPRGVLDG